MTELGGAGRRHHGGEPTAEELQRRVSELASANARIDAFAQALAHDLMQPVGVLEGFLSLLATQAVELTEEHRGWLEGAMRGKERILHVIDTIYRGATDADLTLVPTDLGKVAAQVVEDLAAELDQVDVSVGELPVVLADRDFVVQVLANLIQNAVRYRHDERPLVVEIQARRDGSGWVLAVAGTGKGIGEDELEEVFEPGRRGRSSDGLAGTGTGLATVRTLMRAMGGDAWAEPVLGGAQVCVQFPR